MRDKRAGCAWRCPIGLSSPWWATARPSTRSRRSGARPTTRLGRFSSCYRTVATQSWIAWRSAGDRPLRGLLRRHRSFRNRPLARVPRGSDRVLGRPTRERRCDRIRPLRSWPPLARSGLARAADLQRPEADDDHDATPIEDGGRAVREQETPRVDVARAVRLVGQRPRRRYEPAGSQRSREEGETLTFVIGRAGRRLEPLTGPQRLDVAQAGRDQQPLDTTCYARQRESTSSRSPESPVIGRPSAEATSER
jgi:hypothetical protein